MLFNYTYRQTKTLEKYQRKLVVYKQVIDLLPRLPHVEENLQRRSLLHSAVFSARIEGNKLTPEAVDLMTWDGRTKEKAKIEIFNILKALRWIHSSHSPKKITPATILKLHKFALIGISENAGQWRKEPGAIFNQAGMAIYFAPPEYEILGLITQLIKKNNILATTDLVRATLFHFIFEKIHPFLDGNGRVGRLLVALMLKNSGFGFRGLVSPEEFLEERRHIYYELLAKPGKDITRFIEFFLEALSCQAEKAITSLKDRNFEFPEDTLLPRRREILEIIKEHRMASFDFIRRRFGKINSSTLHYDLQQLIKKRLIKKLGTTRGVVYIPS